MQYFLGSETVIFLWNRWLGATITRAISSGTLAAEALETGNRKKAKIQKL